MAEMKSMKDIATFTKEEVQNFLESFDTIISDCDGVLWVFGNPISGCSQTLSKLMSLGKKVMLMSNNSILPIRKYVQLCQILGMPLKEEDIFSTATGIAMFLKSHNIKDKVLLVGSESLRSYLQEKGIQCCETSITIVSEDVGALRAELERFAPDVKAVVMDTDMNLIYSKLMKAVYCLKNPDCLFVVGATDDNVFIGKNIGVLGPGYFASIVEKYTGRKPMVIGKPSTYMADSIVKERSLDPARVLFIGDSLTQDITLGRNAGFQTLLVLSGLSQLSDVNETNQPDYYIRTLSDLLPLLP